MADAPRARKVADRIKTLIAAGLDPIVKDPDLGFVTITDVRVTNDLQHASVFYTVFGDEDQRAKTAYLLEANAASCAATSATRHQAHAVDRVSRRDPETAAHLEVCSEGE